MRSQPKIRKKKLKTSNTHTHTHTHTHTQTHGHTHTHIFPQTSNVKEASSMHAATLSAGGLAVSCARPCLS
jgi:ABC-type nickel/cobalt efflux system permease component RcnA